MSAKETSDACGTVPPEEIRRNANKERTKVTDKCVKCKVEKSTLIFRRESTCWKCFEQQCIKKFKGQLNLKQKNRSEPVLIAFSGGPSSRALIEILHECIAGRNKASAYFEVKGFIHIDEGTILELSEEEKKEKERVVRLIAEKYGCPLHFVPLEHVFLIPNLLETLEESSDFDREGIEEKEEKLKLSLFLCGGCKRVLSEVEEDSLPPFIRSHAEKTSNSFKLREQIKDFLIGEE
eukprot:TRINITY_DN1646_c0_g1_i2.p1 TRINITY_DN1646_c0_g1~~TRINITY_DN1646_c0_g1_i2.p1  ORF type:complete len:245 (+),score=111.98 TRINITY_DN1646_c0_g1_i2:30-737(+)